MKTIKNTLKLLILLLFVATSANAQEFKEVKKQSNGFDVESGTDTQSYIVVEGKEYLLFVTESGSIYVKQESTKGKVYAFWIAPEQTGETFNGHDVYKSNSGKFYYYLSNGRGGLKRVRVEKI